jgi:uncharacterized protein (TIGR03663 family)
MSRAVAGAVVAMALVAGAALRAARLDARPMHHDEANQAIKFGALLEHGDYRYDSRDHHGPTLYYLTLPSAWIGERQTLASLDEHTLRRVPVVFGIATILLLPLLSIGIGRTATATAAVLMAVSPVMVFYSRMYIQETLFAAFTLAFVIGVGRIATGGGRAWWGVAGIAAGLAAATKETAVVVLPSAIVACAIAWRSCGRPWPALSRRDGRWRASALLASIAAIVVAAAFYTSFFTAPAALLEPFRGAGTYLSRGVDPADHAHPWHYYLRLVTYSASGGVRWSEGLIVGLAAIGATAGWIRRDRVPGHAMFWIRYLACDVVVTGGIFSVIPYKTPWNVLPFYAVAIALAGCGFAAVLEIARGRAMRGVVTAALALGSLQLGLQAWRAAVTYAADPRNPYVYAQTVPDAVCMAARIRDLSALDPRGTGMQVSVMAPADEQWPLPWYLRAMPNVGYWDAPGDPVALQAPVVVASIVHAPALDAALGDRYVSEYYGLRPGVFQALYVERGLWERFLAQVR